MSFTKRAMKADAAENLANEKASCGCTYNWDDKFEVLCDEHQAESDESDREYQWSIYVQHQQSLDPDYNMEGR